MPPPPAPGGAPGKPGLDLKRLPPWAWGVAIAGGAIVGFFLLKKPPSSGEGEEEEGDSSSSSGEQPDVNPVVASPLDDSLLGALGLYGHEGELGGGGFDFSGGDTSTSSSTSSGSRIGDNDPRVALADSVVANKSGGGSTSSGGSKVGSSDPRTGVTKTSTSTTTTRTTTSRAV